MFIIIIIIIIIITMIIIHCNNNSNVKHWAIVGPKLSRPPGDLEPRGPDYQGTTVMNLPADRYLHGPGPSVQIWA